MKQQENISFFMSLGKKTEQVFKPILSACDALSDAFNGSRSIISIKDKTRLEIIKIGHDMYRGKLLIDGKLKSSYTSDPEVIATQLNSDLFTLK